MIAACATLILAAGPRLSGFQQPPEGGKLEAAQKKTPLGMAAMTDLNRRVSDLLRTLPPQTLPNLSREVMEPFLSRAEARISKELAIFHEEQKSGRGSLASPSADAEFMKWLEKKVRVTDAGRSPEDAVELRLAVLVRDIPFRRMYIDPDFAFPVALLDKTGWSSREKWQALVVAADNIHSKDVYPQAVERGRADATVPRKDFAALLFRLAESQISSSGREYRDLAVRYYAEAAEILPAIDKSWPANYCWLAVKLTQGDGKIAQDLLAKARDGAAGAGLSPEVRDRLVETIKQLSELIPALAQAYVQLHGDIDNSSTALLKAGTVAPVAVTGTGSPANPSLYRLMAFQTDLRIDVLDARKSYAQRFDSLYGDVPAAASFSHADCKTEPCRLYAYAVMARIKGLLVAALNQKRVIPISVRPAELQSTFESLARLKEPLDYGHYPPALQQALLKYTGNALVTDPVKDGRFFTDVVGIDFPHLLRPGEAFLDLYQYHRNPRNMTETRYLAVLTQWPTNKPAPDLPQFIELSENATPSLDPRIWYDRAVNKSPDADRALQSLIAETAARLQHLLNSNVRALIVAPDGAYSQFPWHLTSRPLGRPVLTVLSLHHLASLRNRKAGASSVQTAVIVKDVDYGPGATFAPIRSLDGFEEYSQSQRAKLVELSARQVTKANLLRILPTAAMAHLQTHGTFTRTPDQAASFENSYLALTDANRMTSDTRINAMEFAALDLSHMDLLTLAACESAAGSEIRGQGILGFSAAASAAGVKTSLLSLWDMPNNEGPELLRLFYANLKRERPSAALAEAQAVIRAKTPDPFHWAGWVLIGLE